MLVLLPARKVNKALPLSLPYGMESVARTSGLVHLGDVIVAIDGINVLSKSYQGIIDALKSKPKDDGVRRIKFRKSVVRLNFFSVCRFFCIT